MEKHPSGTPTAHTWGRQPRCWHPLPRADPRLPPRREARRSARPSPACQRLLPAGTCQGPVAGR